MIFGCSYTAVVLSNKVLNTVTEKQTLDRRNYAAMCGRHEMRDST